MFSYIMLGTNDLPHAITFYDPLMEMLGYPRDGRNENVAWWGVFNGNNTTALGIGRPFDKQDATTGNGVMVALIARSAEHIQQLHALALTTAARTREDLACARITAKVSTALMLETPMATSWLSSITPHNPEYDKSGASAPPPETKPIPQISEERWTS